MPLRRLILLALAFPLCARLPATASVTPPAPPAPSGLALSIDAAAGRHAISPYISGLNFATAGFAAEIGLPLRRWGGNATTRYNWQGGYTNHAADWFFHNSIAYDAVTGTDETAEEWAAQNAATGAASLLTLPLASYVAKDGAELTCGFNAVQYPGQDDVNDEDGFPQCGNGLIGGVPITHNDPLDTSQVIGPADVAGWVADLEAAGAVQFYGLDNEPDLWHETHRDLWHTAWKYTEFRDRTYAYAAALKAAAPSAALLGPDVHGWTYYWHSPYDGQREDWSTPDDRNTNGGTPFVEWYLQQMAAYEAEHGLRLLDYLDLHFYPQSEGVALAPAGDAEQQARRLRSLRALWDPAYVDESWIADAGPEGGIVRLLPRMRAWVDDHYPGTGLALTEYNWGGLEHINGALAQAEILGLFGREGLDIAALWNYPDANLGYDHFETLPGAYAFRLYRNYDGAGSRFGDVSVATASADPAALAVYAAQRAGDGALTVLVLNKTAGALTGDLSLAGFTPSGPAQVYRYSAANLNAIVPQPDQAVTPTGFSASFPANSATLLVLPGAAELAYVYVPVLRR